MLRVIILISCAFFLADGEISSHIFGGTDATPGQFPYMAGLQFNSPSLGWELICGAILYNDIYAITAAHCLDQLNAAQLQLIVGGVARDGSDGQIINVQSFMQHRNYTVGPGLPNDIAILTLSSPPEFTDTVLNAEFPPDNSDDFLNAECLLPGFGLTAANNNNLATTLQFIQSTAIDNNDCDTLLAGQDTAIIFDTNICVYDAQNQQATSCTGDFGGPLVCTSTVDGKQYVVGVQVYGVTTQGNCDPRYPTVSQRISEYLPWIFANTP